LLDPLAGFTGVNRSGGDGKLMEKTIMNAKMDIEETKDGFKLQVDVPGVDKKDLKVEIDNDKNVLHISGERKHSSKEESKSDGGYYRYERSYGSFQRSVRLPDNIDREKIAVKSENGVLSVTLPKKEGSQSVEPRRVLPIT